MPVVLYEPDGSYCLCGSLRTKGASPDFTSVSPLCSGKPIAMTYSPRDFNVVSVFNRLRILLNIPLTGRFS